MRALTGSTQRYARLRAIFANLAKQYRKHATYRLHRYGRQARRMLPWNFNKKYDLYEQKANESALFYKRSRQMLNDAFDRAENEGWRTVRGPFGYEAWRPENPRQIHRVKLKGTPDPKETRYEEAIEKLTRQARRTYGTAFAASGATAGLGIVHQRRKKWPYNKKKRK